MKELRLSLQLEDMVGLVPPGLMPPVLPDRWDPTLLIQVIHELGAWLGYERVRIDRQSYPGEDKYFEVGYGSHTVRVRTSWGDVWEVTKENYHLQERGPSLLQVLMQGVPADA